MDMLRERIVSVGEKVPQGCTTLRALADESPHHQQYADLATIQGIDPTHTNVRVFLRTDLIQKTDGNIFSLYEKLPVEQRQVHGVLPCVDVYEEQCEQCLSVTEEGRRFVRRIIASQVIFEM